MEVITAECAGFCYGVKRAMDLILEVARLRGGKMFTVGPLIHNPQVTEKLRDLGVFSVDDLAELPADASVVLPTHGISADELSQIEASGLQTIDATCPFVARVHRIAEDLVKQGYQVVVVGDAGHTEVRGILSRAGDNAVLVADVTDLEGVPLRARVGVLAQTTQILERFTKIVASIASLAAETRAFNTICNATVERQQAALDLARRVDAMVVVGGRNSANTRRLAEICAETAVPTYHVEVANELQPDWFSCAGRVGVTAGASTPDWIIQDVVAWLASSGNTS